MHELRFPSSPLPISVVGRGWVPEVALHRRGHAYVHEPAYAPRIIALVILSVGFLLCLIPTNQRPLWVDVPLAKYVLAGLFLTGVAFSASFFFIGFQHGQRLVIDPARRKLTLRKSRQEAVLHWLVGRVQVADRIRHGKPVIESVKAAKPENIIVLDYSDVIGIQICGGPKVYQTNLVFRTSAGIVDRDCLTNHADKRFCVALARQYEQTFGFRVIDDSVPHGGSKKTAI